MEEFLNSKSLTDLKSICKQHGLSQRGNKDSLIKTLTRFFLTPEGFTKMRGIFPVELEQAYESLRRNHPINTDSTNFSCICSNESGPLISCSNCQKIQHFICMRQNVKLTPYLCPNCILMKINPLDGPINELLKPWTVKSNYSNSQCNYEITEKSLELSSEIKEEIKKGASSVQIQLRCIRLDGKSVHMCWPQKGFLIINNKVAMRFETSSNPNAKKRKDEPLNITTIINLGKNTIGIIQVGDPQYYAVGAFLIKRRTDEALIQEVKRNPMSIEQSKDYIKSKLKSNDDDVLSNSIKFSLKCPLTLQLIDSPVRGTSCAHIQCFNLEHYISIQRTSKINRWLCPICKGYVYDMIYDSYLEIIFREARNIENAFGVEIFPNADYKILNFDEYNSIGEGIPMKRKNENNPPVPTKMQKSDQIDIIELDD